MTLNDIKFAFWVSTVMALVVACLFGYMMFAEPEHPEFKPGTHEKSEPTYDSKGQLEWTSPGWKNEIVGYKPDGTPIYDGDRPGMWIGNFSLCVILPILSIPVSMMRISGADFQISICSNIRVTNIVRVRLSNFNLPGYLSFWQIEI